MTPAQSAGARARRGAAAALALLAVFAAPAAAKEDHAHQWRPLALTARPIDLDPEHPGQRRVGALIFRGGLELRSKDWAFGGWSGLWVGPEGRFLAITDRGLWLSARIRSDPATAAPKALTQVELGFIRDAAGVHPVRSKDRDTEGLARLDDGRFAVSFERSQSIRVYDLDRLGPAGAAIRAPALIGADRLLPNVGIESTASMGDGRLLAASERGEGGASYSIFWLLDPNARAPAPPVARLALPFGFGLSDLDRLPDGDFVALERFYAPVVGVRIRLARLYAASLAGGGPVRETELAVLAPPLRIDNFEGVAAIPLRGGGARLFLISDDNYSPTQRTLFYVFDLPPHKPPAR
jgi:hypothetical protein